jgi:DNA-directed RNA polymerase specialized sigma24 family protein
MIEKGVISENVDNIEASQNSNIEHRIDLEIAINFIKSNMREKDREIMFLFLMKEPYAEIAKLIGLDVATITNIVSARRKELNEYLNKGLV